MNTFLEEMVETSKILNHATGASLVVIDELSCQYGFLLSFSPLD